MKDLDKPLILIPVSSKSVEKLKRCRRLNICKWTVMEVAIFSPVENKNDLELDFKVFFFMDSCCSDIEDDESR